EHCALHGSAELSLCAHGEQKHRKATKNCADEMKFGIHGLILPPCQKCTGRISLRHIDQARPRILLLAKSISCATHNVPHNLSNMSGLRRNRFRSYVVDRKAQALSVPPAVAGGRHRDEGGGMRDE